MSSAEIIDHLTLLASLVSGVAGVVWGLLKAFAKRMVHDFDQRMASIETRLNHIDQVEGRLDILIQEMPLNYMRRDDYVRDHTAIHTKLDRLYELLVRKDLV